MEDILEEWKQDPPTGVTDRLGVEITSNTEPGDQLGYSNEGNIRKQIRLNMIKTYRQQAPILP